MLRVRSNSMMLQVCQGPSACSNIMTKFLFDLPELTDHTELGHFDRPRKLWISYRGKALIRKFTFKPYIAAIVCSVLDIPNWS